MAEQTPPSVWDSNQYWLKAKSYVQKAQERGSDSPEFALWHAFALEHLARAALCNIHPVLNADPQHLVSMFYGVGIIRTERPKSLPIHSVFVRLGHVLEGFASEHESFCGEMATRRNAELHSGELAFANLKTATWLAQYYEVVAILCKSMGHGLRSLLGTEEEAGAIKLIMALRSDTVKSVRSKIAKHKQLFDSLENGERTRLANTTEAAVVFYSGTSSQCPACGSKSRLRGSRFREGKPYYEGEALQVDVTSLTNRFDCSACDLRLRGEAEISSAGLPPTFTDIEETSLHELFEPEYEMEYNNM